MTVDYEQDDLCEPCASCGSQDYDTDAECDHCHIAPLCGVCLKPWDDVIGDLCPSCYRRAST